LLTKHVFLGLGSNLGDRQAYLSTAIESLAAHDDIALISQSTVIETLPVGNVHQGKFLNAAVEIETTLSAEQLLQVCLDIEQQLDRVRSDRWGPRTIDIDILFFGSVMFDKDGLRIPHPALHTRSFVLIPLVEIAPNHVHPTYHKTVQAMLDAL